MRNLFIIIPLSLAASCTTQPESMVDAIADVNLAWCQKDWDCDRVDTKCRFFSLSTLCDRYVDCDTVLTAKQSGDIDLCVDEVAKLSCESDENPDSCLRPFGLGEE